MIEKNSALTRQLSHIERILLEQEYIDVSRFPLGSDKRTEYHEPSHLARANRDAIDSFKPLRHRDSLPRSLPEAAKHLPQGNMINSGWKITTFSERWQSSFGRLRHRPLLP